MQNIHKIAIRSISVLSLLFVIVGIYFIGTGIVRQLEPGPQQGQSYVLAFWSRILINATFLVFLAISARFLWELRESGLRLSNIIFTLELAYIFGVPLFENWSAKPEGLQVVTSLAATDGTANMGLAPQMIVLYPAVAMLVLNAFWPSGESVLKGRTVNPPTGGVEARS